MLVLSILRLCKEFYLIGFFKVWFFGEIKNVVFYLVFYGKCYYFIGYFV